ncbi:MAG: CarD family transcriptional regulator [Ruminococcaceae bacterium]|nr:CarD family transcriptional regulator [Oscillospiraceae bacterium]
MRTFDGFSVRFFGQIWSKCLREFFILLCYNIFNTRGIKDETEMYKVNDTIVYGTQGVCRIVEITERDFMDKKKEYYVLKPISDKNTTLFVPTDNEAVLSKIRRILSEEEIGAVIASARDGESVWIEDNIQRKERFRAILDSGDHRSLLLMIRSIRLNKQKREAEGKKLHMADERLFKEAEQLLYDEFQYVLKIGKDELISYLFKE